MVSFASPERLLVQDDIHYPLNTGASGDSAEYDHYLEEPTFSKDDKDQLKQKAAIDDPDEDDVSIPSRHGWTEDDYLRYTVPWESPEQRAFIDSLLERRAHYRKVRWLSILSMVLVVAAVGGIVGWLSALAAPANGSEKATMKGRTATTSLYGMGILCLVPLVRISWESQTQYAVVNEEIQRLTQKRLLLIPTPSFRVSSNYEAIDQ